MSVRVAESGGFRRRGPLERLAGVVGRLPEGPLRRGLRGVFRRLLGRRPLRCVLPGGERLRILPEHRFVTWNRAEYEAFRAVVRPGDTVLDAGANVGAYALLFGRWVGDAGRVHAFEPSAGARRGLVAHLALNGLVEVVRVEEAAVAERRGSEALSGDGVDGGTRLDPGGAAELPRVPTVSLDEFCAEHGLRPALIKVDVEGAEVRVLRGARRLLASTPAPAVFVELHPGLWPVLGTSRAELEAELRGQGLRVEPLRPGVDPWSLEGECVRVVRA